MIEYKDEVLTGEPLYTIRNSNGTVLQDNVKIELKTPILQEGTSINKVLMMDLKASDFDVATWDESKNTYKTISSNYSSNFPFRMGNNNYSNGFRTDANGWRFIQSNSNYVNHAYLNINANITGNIYLPENTEFDVNRVSYSYGFAGGSYGYIYGVHKDGSTTLISNQYGIGGGGSNTTYINVNNVVAFRFFANRNMTNSNLNAHCKIYNVYFSGTRRDTVLNSIKLNLTNPNIQNLYIGQIIFMKTPTNYPSKKINTEYNYYADSLKTYLSINGQAEKVINSSKLLPSTLYALSYNGTSFDVLNHKVKYGTVSPSGDKQVNLGGKPALLLVCSSSSYSDGIAGNSISFAYKTNDVSTGSYQLTPFGFTYTTSSAFKYIAFFE